MKIQLKRSNVLEASQAKEPTPDQMEYGELAVNFNNSDPSIFLKDSNDAIVKIAGVGSLSDSGNPNLQDTCNIGSVTTTSITANAFIGDGSQLTGITAATSNLQDTCNVGSVTTTSITANAFIGDGSQLTGIPGGFSGDYNDLTNQPDLFSGDYNDLTNQPTLFSGSYNDLTDKPSSGGGSYNDLTDKPTIGNGTITISQSGKTNQTFTVNQTGGKSISLNDTNTTYSAGNGIALSGTTFSVAGGDGLTQNSNGLKVDSTVVRTSGGQTIAGNKIFSGTTSFSGSVTIGSSSQISFRDGKCRFNLSSGGDFTFNVNNQRIWEADGQKRFKSEAIRDLSSGSSANVRISSSTGIISTGSSIRAIKKDIRPITNEEALNVLENLTPVYYKPRIIPERNINVTSSEYDEHYGFIAEDVYEVDSRLADLNDKGVPTSVEYDRVAAPLLVVCRMQQRLIEDLEQRVAVLEAN